MYQWWQLKDTLIDLFSALGLRVRCLEIWNAHLFLVMRSDGIFGASLQILTNEQLRLKLFPLFFLSKRECAKRQYIVFVYPPLGSKTMSLVSGKVHAYCGLIVVHYFL